MEYMRLGKTELEVSKIAIGAWGIGGKSVWSDMTPDVASTVKLLDAALDCGINYIDTAPVYGIGNSEQILGKALKGKRDRFILQTKCSLNWREEGGSFEYERDGVTVYRDLSPKAIQKDVEDSLKRLETDYIDVLIVHRQSKAVPIESTMQGIRQLIQSGKIRAVGISNCTPDDLKEYERYGHIAVVQEKYSILSQQKGIEFFPVCDKYNTTFQSYGSLEHGLLTGADAYTREYGENDIRTKQRWFKEPMKTAMIKMLANWGKLAEKYSCSVTNLVQAWLRQSYHNLNLLTGFRKINTMMDSVKSLTIILEKNDIALMEKDVREFICES